MIFLLCDLEGDLGLQLGKEMNETSFILTGEEIQTLDFVNLISKGKRINSL